MRRLLHWNPFFRFPRASLLLTLLALAPLAAHWMRFEISSETEILLEGDQRNFASYQRVREILQQDVVLLISMESEDVFSPQSMEAMHRLGEAFLSLPPEAGVVDVKSLTHSVKPVRQGLAISMVPLVADLRPETLESARRYSLQHPLVRNLLVSPDGRHATLTVTYQRDLSTPAAQEAFRKEVDAVLEPFRREGYPFRLLSFPLIEEEIRSTLHRDILQFIPSAVILLVVILWASFRSGKLLLLLVLSQGVLLLLIPGLVRAAGREINVFSSMLFPLLTGMHLTLLIHLFSAFQRARHQEATGDAALERAVRQVFKASAFSALTTWIGMVSLSTAPVRQVHDFGLLGALGMLVVFVMTFGPDLALLRLAFRNASPPAASAALWARKERHLDQFAAALAAWVLRHRWTVIACSALAAVGIGAGVARMRTDIRAVEFLSRDSETRRTAETLDRVYGGINFVQIEFDSGSTNGVNRLPFLRFMNQVHQFAESHPRVSSVYSYAQVLSMINQIWEGDRPESFRLPSNELTLALFVTLLKAQNFPFTDAIADPAFQTAYLVLRTRDMPADRYLEVVREVLEFADRHKPPGVRISATEGIHSILEADRRILRGQLSSASVTAAAIALVLGLLWRSPKLAAISLAANLLPVALMLAISGYAGIPLNSVTVMLAALVLGIAMDDSVHLITHWRDAFRSGGSFQEALRETLRVKAMPILSTSLILVAIFSLFLLFSFPPIIHFGILAAGAFLAAQLTVFTLLPALLAVAWGGPDGGKKV